MTWWTTKVSDIKELAPELQRLGDAAHTIQFVINKDGYVVIISTTA